VSSGTLLDRGGTLMSVKFPLPLPFLRTQATDMFEPHQPAVLESAST
jgi:hypothetical protein